MNTKTKKKEFSYFLELKQHPLSDKLQISFNNWLNTDHQEKLPNLCTTVVRAEMYLKSQTTLLHVKALSMSRI